MVWCGVVWLGEHETDGRNRMIAVMTMNVGYFMSVLAGVFLGSLVCGRFMGGSAAH